MGRSRRRTTQRRRVAPNDAAAIEKPTGAQAEAVEPLLAPDSNGTPAPLAAVILNPRWIRDLLRMRRVGTRVANATLAAVAACAAIKRAAANADDRELASLRGALDGYRAVVDECTAAILEPTSWPGFEDLVAILSEVVGHLYAALDAASGENPDVTDATLSAAAAARLAAHFDTAVENVINRAHGGGEQLLSAYLAEVGALDLSPGPDKPHFGDALGQSN